MQRLLPSQLLRLTDAAVSARPRFRRRSPRRRRDVGGALREFRVGPAAAWRGWPTCRSGSRCPRAVTRGSYSPPPSRPAFELRAFTRVARRMSVATICCAEARGGRRRAASLPHERSAHAAPPRLVADHNRGHVSDGDAEPFLCGVRDALDASRSGARGFGVGKLLLRGLPAEAHRRRSRRGDLAAAFGEEGPRPPRRPCATGSPWVVATPHAQLDWRDRFYLGAAHGPAGRRQGATLRHGTSTSGSSRERIAQPCALLSVAAGRRTGLRHHEDLLRQHAPALLQYPINPSDGSFGVVRSVLIRSRTTRAVVRRLFAYARGRAS